MLFGKEWGEEIFWVGSGTFHLGPDKTCFFEMKRKQAWKHLLRKKDNTGPHILLSPNSHFPKLSSSIFKLRPLHVLTVIISTSPFFLSFFSPSYYLSIDNNLLIFFFFLSVFLFFSSQNQVWPFSFFLFFLVLVLFFCY